MSSAETTHPIEWRDDGAGEHSAIMNGEVVGQIWKSGIFPGMWSAWDRGSLPNSDHLGRFPTASAARSFVEKSVKEAGHGE